jgi:rhamnosyltransferase
MSVPRVSVLLVTYNGIATLPAVLDAIALQQTSWPFEIVAVDSGSTDGTLELLEGRDVTIVKIASSSFNHGSSRNLGVQASRGEFVALLVQDAVPTGPRWLEALTAPLVSDPVVAGTFARQQPREDASAITAHYLRGWFAAGDMGRVASVPSKEAFLRCSPAEQLDLCIFDNVCSCIRKSVWQQFPFRETPIAEDLEWARDVLLGGYSLTYVPDATVIHSHERSSIYELKRTYLVHLKLYQLFGLRTIPKLRYLLRAVTTTVPTHARCLAQSTRSVPLRERLRTFALAFVFPLGQYLGGLAGATGWRILDPKGI